jgi:hypothetical protein
VVVLPYIAKVRALTGGCLLAGSLCLPCHMLAEAFVVEVVDWNLEPVCLVKRRLSPLLLLVKFIYHLPEALLVLLFPCQYVAFLLRPAAYLLVMASCS